MLYWECISNEEWVKQAALGILTSPYKSAITHSHPFIIDSAIYKISRSPTNESVAVWVCLFTRTEGTTSLAFYIRSKWLLVLPHQQSFTWSMGAHGSHSTFLNWAPPCVTGRALRACLTTVPCENGNTLFPALHTAGSGIVDDNE